MGLFGKSKNEITIDSTFEEKESIAGNIEDILEREDFSDYMTEFINKADSINNTNSLVIALNSPWGSGKSFFIDLWRENIVNKHGDKYISISYNAWNNDDSSDALIPIIMDLENIFKNNGYKKDKIKDKIINVIEAASINIVTRIIESNTGINLNNIKDTTLSLNQLSSAETIYDSYKLSLSKKERLRTLINEVLSDSNSKKKLLIFIDDLDRCRPTFAIETLEVVKHFFDIDNIIFIFSVDINQLHHSIKTIYGDIDCIGYIKKFFDYEILLPTPNLMHYIQNRFILSTESETLMNILSFESDNREQLRFTDEYLKLLVYSSQYDQNYVADDDCLNLDDYSVKYIDYINNIKCELKLIKDIIYDINLNKKVSFFNIIKVLPNNLFEDTEYLVKISKNMSLSLRDLNIICKSYMKFYSSKFNVSQRNDSKKYSKFRKIYLSLICMKFKHPIIYESLIRNGFKVPESENVNLNGISYNNEIRGFFPKDESGINNFIEKYLSEKIVSMSLKDIILSEDDDVIKAKNVLLSPSDLVIVNRIANPDYIFSDRYFEKYFNEDIDENIINLSLSQVIYNYVEYNVIIPKPNKKTTNKYMNLEYYSLLENI